MLEKGKQTELEQYQCGNCGRMFYLDPNDKSDLDFDTYRCPYGCGHRCGSDIASTHTRTATVKVERLHLL
jgi:DNA-directed RNA polymerase subunit RPC12/RpoP